MAGHFDASTAEIAQPLLSTNLNSHNHGIFVPQFFVIPPRTTPFPC
jgi:hypothetical protein